MKNWNNQRKLSLKTMTMIHRWICIVLVLGLVTCMLAGCSNQGNSEFPGTGKTVGVAMPTQYSERWIHDCACIKEDLEALGYSVIDGFADDDPQKQISQIESFIEQQVDCIVIAAVDSYVLTEVEAKAKEAGIPIIAYDRLLMDTDAVSYYATFDNKGVGIAIGETIVAQARLEDVREAGDYRTIEFFMGSPDDNNAVMIYNGLMEVLQPYLDDGTLVCRSGKVSFEDTCILRWSQETARTNCEEYLNQYYQTEDLDICASAFDKFSYGCISALENAGYTEKNWPVISGQDAEVEACKYILEGKQSFTVYKDARLLSEKCVTMVNAVCLGTKPEINDTEQYHNNVKNVPSYLCIPVVIGKSNMKAVLIDGGYYTEDEIFE